MKIHFFQAHCTDGARRVTVLTGIENIKNKKDPNRQLFNVSASNIHQHGSYNPITISHDISILTLPNDIKFNGEGIKLYFSHGMI